MPSPMPPLLRRILAVLAGFIGGSVVNMAIITLGPRLIPPPAGTDTTTMEGLKAALPLFGPQHFVAPFLAHALGTLVGAALAARLAGTQAVAYGIGVLFFIGGAVNVAMLPAPMWFNVLDLVGAYLPMAWLGARIGGRRDRG
jgi:hypothetical protein